MCIRDRLWDERRTTVAAHEILHRSGKKEKKHRQSVDAVAATLILQAVSYTHLDVYKRQIYCVLGTFRPNSHAFTLDRVMPSRFASAACERL